MAIDGCSKITYWAGANAVDTTDYITNVSPKDTPFFSLIGSNTGNARRLDSVTDTQAAASAANALVEGGTLDNTATTTRSFEYNYMQIFRKVIEVTGTQEVVAKYGGVKSEMKYQIMKKYKELAQDVEKAFIQAASATGASATARSLDGLTALVSTNTATVATDSATWTGTSDANLAAYEDLLNDLLDAMFETGEAPDTVFVGGQQKRRISKLSTKVTRNIDAMKKTQILSINVYDSDFGTVNVILDRYVPDNFILAVVRSGFRTSYLRRFNQFPLAKTSDSKRVAVLGELTLGYDSQKLCGFVRAVGSL